MRTPVRRVTPSDGTTFWAAAPDGAGWGYLLEKWSAAGARLRVIERRVPWFGRGASGPRDTPPPEIEEIAEDSTGLLYVRTMVVNSLWESVRSYANNVARRAEVERAIDIRIEVIDTRSGDVLASLGPIRPSQFFGTMPHGLFYRSRDGWRLESSDGGETLARIVQYTLRGR
jgi:hypothetical protein